jgi:hypothetical protein
MLTLVGESDSFDLDFAHRGVEREIKNYCQWEIESADYINKLLNGSGTRTLKLGVRNVTAFVKVSLGFRAAINIKHSTASSNAYAKVNVSGNAPVSLGLVVADGSDVGDTTELFSTYTTMTALVAQINARSGNGWSAQLDDADYGIFASTNLIPIQNVYAGTQDGTDPGWTDLMMPDEPLTGYELNENVGSISLPGGWPKGTKNIPATFTAGWTTANMPDDLKQAVAQMINFFYTKHQQGTTGIKSFSLSHLRIEYITEMRESGSSSIPIEVLDVLDADYKASVLL